MKSTNIEVAIFGRTDGALYRCAADTVFSPAEYAAAWEVMT